jgi:hypothetical protein
MLVYASSGVSGPFGIIPIVISAAEHYDNVLRAVKQGRKFAPELQSLQSELETYNCIFKNECVLLLGLVTDLRTAPFILQEKDHPLRKNATLESKLSDKLGATKETYLKTIGLVQSQIALLENQVSGIFKASSVGSPLAKPLKTLTSCRIVLRCTKKIYRNACRDRSRGY